MTCDTCLLNAGFLGSFNFGKMPKSRGVQALPKVLGTFQSFLYWHPLMEFFWTQNLGGWLVEIFSAICGKEMQSFTDERNVSC